MIGEPPLLVSGLASNHFRIRALLSTPNFGRDWRLRDKTSEAFETFNVTSHVSISIDNTTIEQQQVFYIFLASVSYPIKPCCGIVPTRYPMHNRVHGTRDSRLGREGEGQQNQYTNMRSYTTSPTRRQHSLRSVHRSPPSPTWRGQKWHSNMPHRSEEERARRGCKGGDVRGEALRRRDLTVERSHGGGISMYL
jgi:hypothetical protein